MDPIKLQKIKALNKSKKHQYLDNCFVFAVTVLTCTLLCSTPLWFPFTFASSKLFLSSSLRILTSVFFSSKSIFIVGNLIVILLIGESKFFAPNHSTGSEVFYDEYISRKSRLQAPRIVEEKKEIKKEEPSNETTRTISKNGRNIGGMKRIELDGEGKVSLPAEDLSKRADEFIARVNRQRRIEARQLLYDGNYKEAIDINI